MLGPVQPSSPPEPHQPTPTCPAPEAAQECGPMECSQEAILNFLRERGGRVSSSELTGHFRAVFPKESGAKAAAREKFKNFVDNIAFVQTDGGVKYVCVRKRFRGSDGVSERTEQGAAEARDEGGLSQVAVQQHAPPGSDCGSASQVRLPAGASSEDVSARLGPEVDSRSAAMGNVESLWRGGRNSQKEREVESPDIPDISVTEPSPLPTQGRAFTPPWPARTGGTGQAHPATSAELQPPREAALAPAELVRVELRRGSSQVSRCGESDIAEGEEGQSDTQSLSGSDGTPTTSRKHFIRVMMDASPQVRRSMVLRRSAYLPAALDGDSSSVASSIPGEDLTSAALDPLEHEWMMCASDAEWGSLSRLLAADPGLVLRKDFVTGFTCLHWAAKHGKHELMALIVNFARQNHLAAGVEVRSHAGYTPLHVAAMHNHMEVVKLLVGAYDADVEARDYSGRKACQYLTGSASADMRDIIGAYERTCAEGAGHTDESRWRFSKVLQSNRKSPTGDRDTAEGTTVNVVRRKSSFSRMKPKLQRLRVRASQIVHSTSFHDPKELEGPADGSCKSRPKTHFFR